MSLEVHQSQQFVMGKMACTEVQRMVSLFVNRDSPGFEPTYKFFTRDGSLAGEFVQVAVMLCMQSEDPIAFEEIHEPLARDGGFGGFGASIERHDERCARARGALAWKNRCRSVGLEGSRHELSEFFHVARISSRNNAGEFCWAERGFCPTDLSGELPNQQRHILQSFSKGGHDDAYRCDMGSEFFAESSVCCSASKVRRCRGNDASVEDTFFPTLVEVEQRARLAGRCLVDALQEEREGVAALTYRGDGRSLADGESEVDDSDGRRGKARIGVNGLRQKGPSSARLALEEERCIRGGNAFEDGKQLAHHERLAEGWSKGVSLARGDRYGGVAGQELQCCSADTQFRADRYDSYLKATVADESPCLTSQVANANPSSHQRNFKVIFTRMRVAKDQVVVAVSPNEQRAGFEQGFPSAIGTARHANPNSADDQIARRVGCQDACQRRELCRPCGTWRYRVPARCEVAGVFFGLEEVLLNDLHDAPIVGHDFAVPLEVES